MKKTFVKPINVNLEIHEEHFNSFQIMPYHKNLFGYVPSYERYMMHLTDSRVIIEPGKYNDNLNSIMDLIVGTATLVSHYAHQTEHKWNHAKEKMAMLKYTFISIPYKDIQTFKNLKAFPNVNLVDIIIKPTSEILNLEIFKELEIKVFKPFPEIERYPTENWKHLSAKGWGNTFSEAIQNVKEVNRASEDFVETANRLLLT